MACVLAGASESPNTIVLLTHLTSVSYQDTVSYRKKWSVAAITHLPGMFLF